MCARRGHLRQNTAICAKKNGCVRQGREHVRQRRGYVRQERGYVRENAAMCVRLRSCAPERSDVRSKTQLCAPEYSHVR